MDGLNTKRSISPSFSRQAVVRSPSSEDNPETISALRAAKSADAQRIDSMQRETDRLRDRLAQVMVELVASTDRNAQDARRTLSHRRVAAIMDMRWIIGRMEKVEFDKKDNESRLQFWKRMMGKAELQQHGPPADLPRVITAAYSVLSEVDHAAGSGHAAPEFPSERILISTRVLHDLRYQKKMIRKEQMAGVLAWAAGVLQLEYDLE